MFRSIRFETYCSKNIVPGSSIKPEIIINRKGEEPETYFMASLDHSNIKGIVNNYLSNGVETNSDENDPIQSLNAS